MAETLTRAFTLDLGAAADDESIPCVLSSEYAVDRGQYLEILRHTADAVDLSQGFLPVILAHDSRRLPVGVVEHMRLEAGKLRGRLRLGKSAKARELLEEIKSGIIRSLSIGYQILRHAMVGERLIAFKWRPLEVSLVSVPADPSAGLFRSHPEIYTMTDTDTEALEANDTDETTLSRSQRRKQRAVEREAEVESRLEGKRQAALEGLAQHFRMTDRLDSWIADGVTLDEARAEVRQRKPEPIPVEGPRSRIYGGLPAGELYAGDERILRHFGHDERTRRENAYLAGQWVRAAIFKDQRAASFVNQRAMAINNSSGGSTLVPNELAMAIINLAAEYGTVRAHARVWPMASDTLSIPRRRSGLTGYFVGEANEITASDMTLDLVNLVARKYAIRTILSTELAEDSVIDIASLVAEEMGRELARIQDQCAFNGDGTSTYGGIVGIREKLTGTAGAVDAATNHDTFVELTMGDLASTMAKLPSYARRSAAWFVSDSFADEVFVRLSTDSGGVTLAELAGTRMDSFLSYPIVRCEVMPTSDDEADGLICAIFGDMRQAVALGDRRTFSVRVDDITRLAYDQIVIQSTSRWDIVAHDCGDAADAGPLVGLALNT